MQTVNYDSRGNIIRKQRQPAPQFTMVKAQLFIVAMFLVAFSMILGGL